MQTFARELVASKLDVLVTASTPAAVALAEATSTVPIVFVNIFDPVSVGLFASLGRPGGDRTGIMGFEIDVAGKWLSTLREMIPSLKCVGLFFNPATAAAMWPVHMEAAKPVAEMLGVNLIELPVNSTEEIEPRVRAHAERPHSGLIVVPSTFAFTHRDAIIATIAKCRVPAIYGISEMVRRGGLLSYGPDITEQWRAAAGHVDRILRGATPATLPIKLSPKIALTINLNTARALGLTISPGHQARAEQVE